MRLIEKRPSAKDKDVEVFVFSLGKEELKMLLGICRTAYNNVPMMFEFTQLKHRLKNIMKAIKDSLK